MFKSIYLDFSLFENAAKNKPENQGAYLQTG